MDSELSGRKPVERPHRKVVGTTVMKSELLSEVVQRKESVGIIETLLVFPVAVFHLAVVARSIRTDEFMMDTKLF